ncbi:MAG TPA: methyltransferase domain-containing protein [Chloroflexia bacterium]|nr:methyltransferase domain-containing protein [Chloroflexia bacterium]
MTEEVYQRVQASFGPKAHQYTISKGHADTEELQRLVERVKPAKTDTMMDLGTGAGHTALAFAPFVARVVAIDVTPQMLEEVRRNAAARGIQNIVTKQGAAEALPCPDNSFELVSCRLTTHHFADLPLALREMARVLRPGGRLLIVDSIAPEDPELDRQVNQIEVLRDPSHVRNYRTSEWLQLVEEAGLKVVDYYPGVYDEGDKMDFDRWTARIGTSPENVEALRQIFNTASAGLREVFNVEVNGPVIRFTIPILTMIAQK